MQRVPHPAKMHIASAPHVHNSQYMHPTPSCRLAYTSSEQEDAWFASSHAGRICAQGSSPSEVRLARAWVNYTSGVRDFKATRAPEADELRALSRFQCDADGDARDGNVVHSYIEPLTGIARHPLVDVGCRGPLYTTTNDIFDTSYLLLAHRCGAEFSRRHSFRSIRGGSFNAPTSSYYFDMGCAGPPPVNAIHYTQPPSIATFVRMYAARCIVFDRIFGWEVNPQDHSRWWKELPPSLRPITTFFNVPVAKEPWVANSNPATGVGANGAVGFVETLLASGARPEDFVAVKLDVDNVEVELSILHAILHTPGVSELVRAREAVCIQGGRQHLSSPQHTASTQRRVLTHLPYMCVCGTARVLPSLRILLRLLVHLLCVYREALQSSMLRDMLIAYVCAFDPSHSLGRRWTVFIPLTPPETSPHPFDKRITTRFARARLGILVRACARPLPLTVCLRVCTTRLPTELFFEFHFAFDKGTHIANAWSEVLRGATESSLKSPHSVDEALHLMRMLRKRGIRAHFWI